VTHFRLLPVDNKMINKTYDIARTFPKSENLRNRTKTIALLPLYMT